MNQLKAVIYARVSSKEQEESGYSLDSQEKLLKEYALKNDFRVAKVFRVSESASGKQVRKTFNEMIQYATKHKIPIVLCEKIDRLTRNLKDAASVSDWINEDTERQVHFVKESFVVNKNTRAHENLVWDMKVAIARFYTNNLSEEVRKGQKEKVAQGWLPTKPPLGYKTIGEKGHITHAIDEEKAPFIKKAFELYSTGNYSVKALAEKMYKEGLRNVSGKKFGKSRIHATLSNPFYCGKLPWKGDVFEGKQEAIISKELFEMVQKKLVRSNGNPQYQKHLPVFKAKIKCEECGGVIAWETQKGHWYGHCNHYRECSQKTYIRQEEIEKQVLPYLEKVTPKNPRVIEWLQAMMQESHQEEIEYNTTHREGLNRIIRTADQRIENAYRDKLDGAMPASLCEKVMKESTEEKEKAIGELGKLSAGRTAYYEVGYALHEFSQHASAIFMNPKTEEEQKRMLLSFIFSNLTLNADKLGINYTLGFEFIAEWMPKINLIFELEESGSKKGKRDVFASPYPEMYRVWDSNP